MAPPEQKKPPSQTILPKQNWKTDPLQVFLAVEVY